jgi:hypothetical protein
VYKKLLMRLLVKTGKRVRRGVFAPCLQLHTASMDHASGMRKLDQAF